MVITSVSKYEVSKYASLPTTTKDTFRAFWASAGKDGSFSEGDDNLYSFEK